MPHFGESEQRAAAEVDHWYKRASTACAPFLYPETRFRTPWTGEDLADTVVAARAWHERNQCPDTSFDHHLIALLDAYAEMPTATVARVMEIRETIYQHATALDHRKAPRSQRSISA